MCKLDIKDGFWRMCVPSDLNQYHFTYVLPSLDDEPDSDPLLVVPASLQMGWESSPPYFCTGTETGRDIAEYLAKQPQLPPHPQEDLMIDKDMLAKFPFPDPPAAHDPDNPTQEELAALTAHRDSLNKLLEVYMDDYCNLLQSTDPEVLRHVSRALLHAIHQIFPPPTATGHTGEDPISYKKLAIDKEGVWEVRKEILGWIFDGAARTMELPTKKVDAIKEAVAAALRHHSIEAKQFESLIGKLNHALMGTPGGTALLPPLYNALHATKRAGKARAAIHPHSAQAQTLLDLRAIIHILGQRPTKCRQLVPDLPWYIGSVDACKYGMGGVWVSGTKPLHPIVWRFEFPPEITALYEAGEVTINDLEAAAILMGYLLLASVVPVTHAHLALWSDNTSAVSWTRKMSSLQSQAGQLLTRALFLRFVIEQTSPLAPLNIPGRENKLADLPSRSFRAGKADNYCLSDLAFLDFFNSKFPLTQNKSWLALRPRDKLSWLVCSALRLERVGTESWTRLPKYSCDIGRTGSSSAGRTVTWTPFSPTSQNTSELTTSAPSLLGYEKGMRVEDVKSELGRFRTRWQPSARPSNWTADQTPSTSRKRTAPTSTP
jgi:hypothetical protein